MHKIAVFVGSLRQNSMNLKLAKALEQLGGSRFAFDYVEIGDLPLYNDDLLQNPPAAGLRVKRGLQDAGWGVFVAPEVKRAVSGGPKKALQWGARPGGE